MSWIYKNCEEKGCRYVLGYHEGEGKVLICCGINPSTATPDTLDRTMSRVKSFALNNGYNGYLMINVYPQISTDPNGLDREINEEIHDENMNHIREVFKSHPNADVLAAWGAVVRKRPYFRQILRELYLISTEYNVAWKNLHTLTRHGHPRHPLYIRGDAGFSDFDMQQYMT